jgi:hypothetical protein
MPAGIPCRCGLDCATGFFLVRSVGRVARNWTQFNWLCRILRPALGGNTNTVVICTLNLWGGGTDDKESVATLRLGVTAKSIRNQPKRVVAEKGEAMIEE